MYYNKIEDIPHFLSLEYNEDCSVDEFTFIRADGTRMVLKKYSSQSGHDGEIRVEWEVMENNNGAKINRSSGFGRLDTEYNYTSYFDFDFILQKDEKVTIESNGKLFE